MKGLLRCYFHSKMKILALQPESVSIYYSFKKLSSFTLPGSTSTLLEQIRYRRTKVSVGQPRFEPMILGSQDRRVFYS